MHACVHPCKNTWLSKYTCTHIHPLQTQEFGSHWTVTPTMKPWPFVHYSAEFLVSAGKSNWG